MAWKSQRGKWDWRAYLTTEEAEVVKRADAGRDKIRQAQEAWDNAFGLDMKMIANRALQRAKHDALT